MKFRNKFFEEILVIEDMIGKADLVVLAPFSAESHWIAINHVHGVESTKTGRLIPVTKTQCAKNRKFSCENPKLTEYGIEKSNESTTRPVFSISSQELQESGATDISSKLLGLPSGSIITTNAVTGSDLEVFVQALLKAHMLGRRCVYRATSTFVSIHLGIRPIPPVAPQIIRRKHLSSRSGGLIIVGSHGPNTTRQIERLLDARKTKLAVVLADVQLMMAVPEKLPRIISDAAERANRHIAGGTDTLVMTSRDVIVGEDETTSLRIQNFVTNTLVAILRALRTRPGYVITKGGITSSAVVTSGLRMRRAKILGQAAHGVPIWKCNEPTSRFLDLHFVVFPGRVGSDVALRDMVESWATPQ
ncbi:hypothetical protein PT974_05223 [Cladobotryum mycophilum]|uniref:Uncharacterized protein n=1 Tax=Cladobotryum mycophilum TaxID=491253 RepID=A0ABR0SI48_9HYPO